MGSECLCSGLGGADSHGWCAGRPFRAQAPFHGRGLLVHGCLGRLCSFGLRWNADRFPGDTGNRWRRHVIFDPFTDRRGLSSGGQGPVGLWAAVSGLAVAGGSVAGGLLLSVFPWSSVFWVNVPIGIVTVVISQVAVLESREPVPRPFDTGGVALSACGLLLLTFGLVESSDVGWHSLAVAACVAAGAAVLVVFFVWEHRAASPMVPPGLLRTPSLPGPASCTFWPTLLSRDSSTT